MSSVLSRVAVLVGMAGMLAGCLEMAVYDALQDDSRRERGISYDEGRFDSEIFGTSGGGGMVTTVPGDYPTDALDVRSATLEGDFGEVRGIHDDAPLFSGWSFDGYSSVDVHSTLADGSGAAMAILAINGDLDSPEMTPGRHFEFGVGGEGAAGLVYMSLIGCSGPTDGAWEYDQPASVVVVDVSEGSTEDSIVLDYQGTFTAWEGAEPLDQVVIGSVELGATHAAP